jgi:release factor glutamine methyltransferase
MIRLEEALARAATRLAQAGIEAPRREARLLAAHLLGRSSPALAGRDAWIDPLAFDALVERRAAHEPFAFITGQRGFWTLEFSVSPETLIPRADSETLIEAAVASVAYRSQVRRILDLGTGTGCLLLAALAEFPRAWGLGIDIAPGAAALAQRNARACGLADRASFMAGVWADAVGGGAFDLILCNPPYIPAADIDALMPEVSMHEPRRALDGGPDGLDAYRAILPSLVRLLRPAGFAVLELGQGQHADVASLALAVGLVEVACHDDLSGIARALVLKSGVG